MNENKRFGREIASWQVPEYEKHERDQKWYIGAGLAVFGLLVYSYLTANFLFAVIIIISCMIIIVDDSREPGMIDVLITTEGVGIGRRFYDFEEMKNFSVVYKPNQNIKRIYFEFNNSLKQRLSIPLMDINPLPIRENLIKYISEDLERVNEPLSEGLGKLLKL